MEIIIAFAHIVFIGVTFAAGVFTGVHYKTQIQKQLKKHTK